MKTKILDELKSSFESYALFWDEWKAYRYNGLNELEIYALDVHVNNDFKIEIKDFVMFYNQAGPVITITNKLRHSYTLFQDWLIRKFQYEIISFADGVPLDLYFTMQVELFYDVPSQMRRISDDLIKTLLKFKCETLCDIFYAHSGTGFRNEDAFKIVAEFQTIIKIQKTINEVLRKEVNTQKSSSLN